MKLLVKFKRRLNNRRMTWQHGLRSKNPTAEISLTSGTSPKTSSGDLFSRSVSSFTAPAMLNVSHHFRCETVRSSCSFVLHL